MSDLGETAIFIAMSGLAVLLFIVLPIAITNTNQTIQEAEELVLDEEYTTYINGEVVDGKGVDVSRYYVEIDEENKIVKLTTKESRNTYVPTVIPIPIK